MADLTVPEQFRLDEKAQRFAREKVSQLPIPVGSLGRLHDLAIWLAGVRGVSDPGMDRCTSLVFCGDHGVEKHNVSAFPKRVTWANMAEMVEGNATISIYSRLLGAKLCVVDVGVDGPRYAPASGISGEIDFIDRRVGKGTADISCESAMSMDDMYGAMRVGFDVALEYADRTDVFVFGEMGIGNTTSSSAILSAIFNAPADRVTGLGSGISVEMRRNKVKIVDQAVRRAAVKGDLTQPLVCLQQLGGLEIAAIVGATMGACVTRRPVILDGFIVTAAFAVAARLVPGLKDIAVAGTASAEFGYSLAQERLGLEPLLDLGMRLGEGTGAILAWPILRAAAEQLRSKITKEQLVARPAGSSEASADQSLR